jgi:AcrR family transcriptional regulator
MQARSQATREALLAVGRTLLAERELDAISIAEIAAAAGMSVGSFYGRFHDKETYFAELQEQVTQRWRVESQQLLTQLQAGHAPAASVVSKACALVVQTLRADSGFLRSALKHASTHPGSWTPILQAGAAVVNDLEATLAPLLTHLRANQRAPRIRFAMQVVYGTGLNAVLHDPGPLALANPQLERELARVMSAYLELLPSTPRRASAPPNSTRNR